MPTKSRTVRPPGESPAPVPSAAPQRESAASPSAGLSEIVLAGFLNVAAPGQPRVIQEFSRVVTVAKRSTSRTYVDATGRTYEFTGLDGQGRRLFRDHTRL